VVAVVRCCLDCGTEYSTRSSVYAGQRWIQERCPDCAQRAVDAFERDRENLKAAGLLRAREIEWPNQARIPVKFRAATFATFERVWVSQYSGRKYDNTQRATEIEAWAMGMPVDRTPRGYPSLLITAPDNGVGKTHIATAVLNCLLGRFEYRDRTRIPYQFWEAVHVRNRLSQAQRFGSVESVTQVYADFAGMWLLVLDDVGKEKLTGADAAATAEAYYTIVNDRYNARLPMVVASNFGFEAWAPGGVSLEDLAGKATVSRLREMTGGRQYVIAGEDRR